MAEGDQPPQPKRVRLTPEEIECIPREELIQKWYEQEAFVESMISRNADGNNAGEVDDKYRQDAARRENVLVMRLTGKDQELQEYMSQNEELKRSQNPSTSQLRGMLLDPAINLMFQRMKKEMEQCKEKLEQAQNDLAAWKFTPDGHTGKRLMAKCRMLLQENAELGKVISAGRTAKLEGEIALGKKFVEEMKQSQAETDEFLVEMDEDVEGLQSTIYLLQQQLREAKDQINDLQQQLSGQNRTNSGQTSNRDSANPPKVKEEHMDSLAGEQRTTGNGNSNSNNKSGSGSSGRDHNTGELHLQTTTNGSSHHSDMDTDSSLQQERTAINHDEHHHSRHLDGTSASAQLPMETDSGLVSDTSRTAVKVKVETSLQNGMLEAQGTA